MLRGGKIHAGVLIPLILHTMASLGGLWRLDGRVRQLLDPGA